MQSWKEERNGLTETNAKETCFVLYKTLANTNHTPSESQSREPYSRVEALQTVEWHLVLSVN